MAEATERNVPIVLHSLSARHAIPEETYMIPASWRRFQLSELINKVLASDKAVPFDFFVGETAGGERLRGSLGDVSATGEELIHLTYLPSILPPTHLSTYNHDDWVSSVAITPSPQPAAGKHFLTGSYDGVVRVWNGASETVAELRGHEGPVSGVCWVPTQGQKDVEEGEQWVASSSHDRTVRVWKIPSLTPSTNVPPPSTVLTLPLHTAAVSSVTSALPSSGSGPVMLLSAGWDGLVGLWEARVPSTHEVPEEEDVEDGGRKKKRRRNAGTDGGKRKAPLHVLRGHTGTVSRAVFSSQDSSVGFSAGHDHTVRSWDLDMGVETAVRHASTVIRSIDVLAGSNVLVTGHADRTVCLWDTREEATNISVRLVSHTSHISTVRAHPTSPHLLSSAGLDGTMRLWDARSPKQPLFMVVRAPGNDKGPEEKKILGMDWDGEVLASGGEDCAMQLHRAEARQ